MPLMTLAVGSAVSAIPNKEQDETILPASAPKRGLFDRLDAAIEDLLINVDVGISRRQ